MKIYALNGSPRKKFSTATLLQSYLEGAKKVSEMIEAEFVNLYDYDFKGCYECYLCKMKNGKSYGECGYHDDIRQLLKDVSQADGIVIGAPIFLGDMNAQTKAFIERLLYPFKKFSKDEPEVTPPKKIHVDFIHTMNVDSDFMQEAGYPTQLATTHNWAGYVFGHQPGVLYSCFTRQYKDYDKYAADFWDVEAKLRHHAEQFPKDCQKALEMGQHMAETLLSQQND